MNQYVQTFVSTVSSWDGIETEPHRFGGTEFKLGQVEIGHIHHGNGMLDIPFTVKLREVLVGENKTGLHHLLRDSGWTTFYIRQATDLEQALWLMRLSYLQKLSRRNTVERTEIESLNLSNPIRQAAFPRL